MKANEHSPTDTDALKIGNGHYTDNLHVASALCRRK
jgi:hypothetical protein